MASFRCLWVETRADQGTVRVAVVVLLPSLVSSIHTCTLRTTAVKVTGWPAAGSSGARRPRRPHDATAAPARATRPGTGESERAAAALCPLAHATMRGRGGPLSPADSGHPDIAR